MKKIYWILIFLFLIIIIFVLFLLSKYIVIKKYIETEKNFFSNQNVSFEIINNNTEICYKYYRLNNIYKFEFPNKSYYWYDKQNDKRYSVFETIESIKLDADDSFLNCNSYNTFFSISKNIFDFKLFIENTNNIKYYVLENKNDSSKIWIDKETFLPKQEKTSTGEIYRYNFYIDIVNENDIKEPIINDYNII